MKYPFRDFFEIRTSVLFKDIKINDTETVTLMTVIVMPVRQWNYQTKSPGVMQE